MGTFHHSVSQQNAKQFLNETLFLKLVHMVSYVNDNIQLFWFKRIRLVPNSHTLTSFASGALCLVTMANL